MTPAPAGNQGILFMPGFTRHVVTNGVLEEVKPQAVVCASRKCGYVGCTFATESESGLSTHRQYCKFKTDPDPEPRDGQATDVLALLSAHGLAAHASEDDADADADDGDGVPVASSKRKRDGRAGNRGAKKRKRYTNDFKAEALDLLATAEGQGWQLQAVAERLGVSPGMLSSWRRQAEVIYSSSGSALTKNLKRAALKTRAENAKYPAMEKKLHAEVLRNRARGRLLSIRWLVFTARRLFDALYPDDAGTFLASCGWRRRFFKRYRLTRRKTTKTKRLSVTERLPHARDYHQKLALLVTKKPPGKLDAPMDPKYGRFPVDLRFNMDEVPLPFTRHRDSTIEEVGKEIVQVKQPDESLFKRQGTAVLWIRPLRVMSVTLIFRGTGTVLKRERHLYDDGSPFCSSPRRGWLSPPCGSGWRRCMRRWRGSWRGRSCC